MVPMRNCWIAGVARTGNVVFVNNMKCLQFFFAKLRNGLEIKIDIGQVGIQEERAPKGMVVFAYICFQTPNNAVQ